MDFINISGYKFSSLADFENLECLQHSLKSQCQNLHLKGTILLSVEGLNIFLSGQRKDIDQFYIFLEQNGLEQISFKESLSSYCPFDKLIVKIKPEIITMGMPTISPVEESAPTISPKIFNQWFTENKAMIVLDTRNEYEVDLGKFTNAVHLNIRHFRTFPQAAEKFITEHAHEKDMPIVTYCTGGIRCEKAALYLKEKGFTQVFQLEGGILNYLAQNETPYFEGECFVFDKRISLDHQLHKSQTTQCYACREPVTAEAQQSPHYVLGISCPSCYTSAE